ncbi:MAG: ABC transporter permease [Amaricoccus sp.]|nr:ABC transporter permease [Amaricoccus sp.]MBP7242494.1 ABC transporter permease [Amaricoccus sp.]
MAGDVGVDLRSGGADGVAASAWGEVRMRKVGPALAAFLLAGAASAATTSALGTWTVTKVETDPSMPVTAVAPDDPSYLGAVLSVTSARIAWNAGKSNGRGTYDDCVAPRFTGGRDGIAVTCAGTAWGPGAVLTPVTGDKLRLDWYDGAVLILTRD